MKRMRILLAIAGAVASLALLSACATGSGDSGSGVDESTVVGEWAESDLEDTPFLKIEDDGSFSGKDGCNNIFGNWEQVADGSIEFSEVGSTMMYCDGVDTWLSTAATGHIEGDVMTIEDENGDVIGELTSR